MADGNNTRCFSPDSNCPCGCVKASPQEMRSAFRKRRASQAGKPTRSVAKAKENAVEAAIEQSCDPSSEP